VLVEQMRFPEVAARSPKTLLPRNTVAAQWQGIANARKAPGLIDRLLAEEKEGVVEIKWNTVLAEVTGDASGVTGLRLKHVDSDTVESLEVQGLSAAIGYKPKTEIFAGQLGDEGRLYRHPAGLTGNTTATSVPGVFASGDVQDQVSVRPSRVPTPAAWSRSTCSATSKRRTM
jgi:thioredoxin reductase